MRDLRHTEWRINAISMPAWLVDPPCLRSVERNSLTSPPRSPRYPPRNALPLPADCERVGACSTAEAWGELSKVVRGRWYAFFLALMGHAMGRYCLLAVFFGEPVAWHTLSRMSTGLRKRAHTYLRNTACLCPTYVKVGLKNLWQALSSRPRGRQEY